MGEIRVGIIGVGNCASALVQGVHYYHDVDEEDLIPGLLYANFGGYHISDVKFVAAFDVDKNKVGKDLSKAIIQKPNNTRNFVKVPIIGIDVKRGRILDSIGRYVKDVVKIDETDTPVDVSEELKNAKVDVVLNYLPVGSEEATQWYAKEALNAGCAFINCMPSFIASNPYWQKQFEKAGLPVSGDDVMSQIGATVLHKTLVKLLFERGIRVSNSYQLNIGGDTDFLNMLEQERLKSKRISKTSAVEAMVPYKIPLRIGPSDYVSFLENKKICYISVEGSYFGDTPVKIDIKLDVWDAPNSAGVVIDAIRATKIALDRGISGPLTSISSFCFKHPPIQMPYEEAKLCIEEFIKGKRDR